MEIWYINLQVNKKISQAVQVNVDIVEDVNIEVFSLENREMQFKKNVCLLSFYFYKNFYFLYCHIQFYILSLQQDKKIKKIKKIKTIQGKQQLQQMSQKFLHLKNQYPFYKTFIDLECRKDILTQNEHSNKKVRSTITPFLTKIYRKAKQNKFRLAYFFGFIVLFKMQPIYNYIFCNNQTINRIQNELMSSLEYKSRSDVSLKQVKQDEKLRVKKQQNKRLAEMFYKVDKDRANVVGYNELTQEFVNDEGFEISFQRFVEICGERFGGDVGGVEERLRRVYRVDAI